MAVPNKMALNDLLFGPVAAVQIPEVLEAEIKIVEQPLKELPEVMPAQNAVATVDTSERIDFNRHLETVSQLVIDQAQLSQDTTINDIAALEMGEVRVGSYMNAITNMLGVTHLADIISADDVKFKRRDEMEVLNPLLQSYKAAARSSNRVVSYLARQLDRNVDAIEELEQEGIHVTDLTDYALTTNNKELEKSLKRVPPDGDEEVANLDYRRNPDRILANIGHLHMAFDGAVDSVNKITGGMEKLLQLDRYSGSKPWGNMRAGGAISSGAGASQVRKLSAAVRPALEDNSSGSGGPGISGGVNNNEPREISAEELMELALRAQRTEF